MELNEVIESIWDPKLTAEGIEIVDILWTNFDRMKVLQIQIMNEDGIMDLDTCAHVSELISVKLDELNAFDFDYSLEVCSPGAERPLKTEKALQKAIGQYICVTLKQPQNGLDQVIGDLVSADENHLSMTYRVKQANKKIDIKREDIAGVRLAVKV